MSQDTALQSHLLHIASELPAGDATRREILAALADRTAANPPFWNAAKADEAVGEAYRLLIDLKLGFDSWEEIPRSAQPLYDAIMEAMNAVGNARKDTNQVREMVRRKRY